MRLVLAAVLVLLLSGDAHARSLTLYWDAPLSGPTPEGYVVYKQWPGATSFELVEGTRLLTWHDRQVPNGETCWYVVSWNEDGESGPSNTVCVHYGKPAR